MSYLSRQQRLATLLGANHPGYVFQVFAGHLVQSLSEDFMNKIAKMYEIKPTSLEKRFELPKTTIGQHSFESGYVGSGGSALIKTQLLYTSHTYSPQVVDTKMKEGIDHITGAYERKKYELAPHIGGSRYNPDTGEGHQFAFIHRISEYSFEHHRPREMGIFKPCTLIPDLIIQPEQQNLTSLSPIQHP